MVKIDKHVVIYSVLFAIIAFLSLQFYFINNKMKSDLVRIQTVASDGLSTSIYYDQTIASLKKENKELYDSVKAYKSEIDYLVQFKYKKRYKTDTVFIDTTMVKDTHVYEYKNSDNDSINYRLEIASREEPSWYKLDLEVSDKFTIVNKRDDGINITDIKSDNGGELSSVVTVKKKKSWKENFSFGPSVNVGYDPLNKNMGVMVGFGLSYKIPLSRK